MTEQKIPELWWSPSQGLWSHDPTGTFVAWQPHTPSGLAEQQPEDAVQLVPSAATQTAEQARTDPNYFRHCDWPGCLRAYDVRTGPDPEVDGKPWVLIRSVRTLFCPEHQDVGHRPQRFEWAPGDTTIAMSCECGTREEGLTPTNTQRCIDWWSDHVLAAGSPVTETTKQQVSEHELAGFLSTIGINKAEGLKIGKFLLRGYSVTDRDPSGVTSETEKR